MVLQQLCGEVAIIEHKEKDIECTHLSPSSEITKMSDQSILDYRNQKICLQKFLREIDSAINYRR